MFGNDHADPCDETLGGRVSLARDAKALSMEDAAQRLGVLASSWRAWECDRDVPRANRLTMMAGVLGVSPIWLLTGLGEGPVRRRHDNHPENLSRAIDGISNDIEALNERVRRIAEYLAKELTPVTAERPTGGPGRIAAHSGELRASH